MFSSKASQLFLPLVLVTLLSLATPSTAALSMGKVFDETLPEYEAYEPTSYERSPVIDSFARDSFPCSVAALIGNTSNAKYNTCLAYLQSSDIGTDSIWFAPAMITVGMVILVLILLLRVVLFKDVGPALPSIAVKVAVATCLVLMILCSSISFAAHSSIAGSGGELRVTIDQIDERVQKVSGAVDNFNSAMQIVTLGGTQLEGVNNGSACKSKNDTNFNAIIQGQGSVIREVGRRGEGSFDVLVESLSLVVNTTDDLSRVLDEYIDPVLGYLLYGVIAFVVFFVLIGILVALGVFHRKARFGSFVLTYLIGITYLIWAGVLLGVEVGILQVISSSVCYPDPIKNYAYASTVVTDVVAEQDQFRYYVSCEGTTVAKTTFERVFKDTYNASNIVLDFELEDESLATKEQCDNALLQANEGFNRSYQTMFQIADAGAVGCKIANEPLISMLRKQLCGDVIAGLYRMFAAHLSACIFMYLAMLFMPFISVNEDREQRGAEDPGDFRMNDRKKGRDKAEKSF